MGNLAPLVPQKRHHMGISLRSCPKNDLPGNCDNSIPLLNADDAKFLHIGAPGLKFQLDLSRSQRWSELQKLPLNLDKCSHMSIPLQDKVLYFSGQPIKKKSLQKDLVVVVSDDLNWYEHNKKAATKARNVLWMVKRSSPMLYSSAKLNIYKSMIVPILIYGSNIEEEEDNQLTFGMWQYK